jgi:hypothetical protein
VAVAALRPDWPRWQAIPPELKPRPRVDTVATPEPARLVPRWNARAAIDMGDFIRAGRASMAGRIVAEKARVLLRQLAAAQEAEVEMFLVSGAMPRDLCIEEGPVQLESCDDVSTFNHRLTASQSWRMV